VEAHQRLADVPVRDEVVVRLHQPIDRHAAEHAHRLELPLRDLGEDREPHSLEGIHGIPAVALDSLDQVPEVDRREVLGPVDVPVPAEHPHVVDEEGPFYFPV
jgi:hypothetical protein